MKNAIKIHCQHCAVWQLVPILKRPQTVVKLFQQLQKAETEEKRDFIFRQVSHYIGNPIATFRWNFEGGGYYINGIPQADEIHTDESGKRHRIIGNFSEYFCE
jgi:hypothetical protein